MDTTDDRLNINRTFRISRAIDRRIDNNVAELGTSASEYLRVCEQVVGPVLMQHPELLSLDRRELDNLASYIGNTLVIHPQVISFRNRDEG